MTVDTLAVAQRLTGDGMPTEQAEAVAGSFRDVTALDRTDLLDRFATREDLLELKQELLAADARTEAGTPRRPQQRTSSWSQWKRSSSGGPSEPCSPPPAWHWPSRA